MRLTCPPPVARRPRLEQRRVNVDFPIWMVEQLDLEASRLGVTRHSIIKVWLAERLNRAGDSADSHTPEALSTCPPAIPPQQRRTAATVITAAMPLSSIIP